MTTPPEQVEQLLATAQQCQSRYATGELAWQIEKPVIPGAKTTVQ